MKTALRITVTYLIVGLLWIFVSDEIVLSFIEEDVAQLKYVQTIKGILFVLVTAIILFLLLLKYYKKLDRKISELENLNRQLQNSNKELEQFAYIASHDLQEPLRMIHSFLNQLKTKYSDKLDQKANQYIFYAVDGAERMRQIILDLLEYSRVGNTDIKKEAIDINEVVNEFCNYHKEDIQEKKAKITFKNLPVVKNYKTSITQIFHNLLDNALKYSRGDVAPEISVTATDKQTHWEFSISDNGIGIPETSLNEVFVIFKRLHGREEFSGTGIGLAIVKKNIEILGGKIEVRSQINSGTIFTFTIKK